MMTHPNGVQSTFTYDALNRVLTVNSQVANSQVAGYTYQRGPTGNLTSATESNGHTVNSAYDCIYWLTNESISGDSSGNNGSASYGLDPVGSRLTQPASLSDLPSGTRIGQRRDGLAAGDSIRL